MRVHTRLLPALLLACLCSTVNAQGFDPANIDWEKLSKIPMRDLFIKRFNTDCAVCHGEDLQGAPLGTPLVGVELRHGDSVPELASSIANGFAQAGMPAWSETLSEDEIRNLALYIAEKRQGTTILDKRDKIPVVLPTGVVETEKHSFTVETVVEGLDAMPFAIEPLPDGRILLTERMRGLRIIQPDGKLSDYVTGTPPVYDDAGEFLGQVQGLGWMLDVAAHPDYAQNGWIYLLHTDRCTGCNALSEKSGAPVSMNRLVRGRLYNGRWIDEQELWRVDADLYTNTSDLAAGGRIAFDNEGYVYVSLGMKDVLDFMGVQELDMPHGKILRLHDDGRVPADNPFVDTPDALPAIWSYGHRSSQGLAFDASTGDLWNTEMGPRGGDELNRLEKGGNFGWPVFTNGVNYDGRPVNGAKKLGITLSEDEVIFPVVDWTPSIAISNLLFYSADEFPGWENNILAGTLRATDLLRMEVSNGEVVHTEVLLEDLARFRDLAIGRDGELFVLLENKSGSLVVRLKPAD